MVFHESRRVSSTRLRAGPSRSSLGQAEPRDLLLPRVPLPLRPGRNPNPRLRRRRRREGRGGEGEGADPLHRRRGGGGELARRRSRGSRRGSGSSRGTLAPASSTSSTSPLGPAPAPSSPPRSSPAAASPPPTPPPRSPWSDPIGREEDADAELDLREEIARGSRGARQGLRGGDDAGRGQTLADPLLRRRDGRPYVFSRADAVEGDAYDFFVRDVCAAAYGSAAAAAAAAVSVDGATRVLPAASATATAIASPAAAAVTHVLHNKQEFPFVAGVGDLLVVSIGNGGGGGSASEAAEELLRIAGAAQADMVDQALAFAFGESRSASYVRIQGDGVTAGRTAEAMLAERSVESVLFRGRRMTETTNGERLDWRGGAGKEEERRRRSKTPTVLIKPAAAAVTRARRRLRRRRSLSRRCPAPPRLLYDHPLRVGY
uniref:Uncharacterized protein n=1 Tax=Ananas comosus var. bracteatus TaxID=296719 RepID=A0A6V7NPS6_ANACO|nr:unnamed protein product [Ananas comosus var. bracteatus]